MPNRHQTRAVRTCIDFLLAKAGRSALPPAPQAAPEAAATGG